MNTHDTIKHHMALAFFGSAYADAAEEAGEPLRGEIMDQLPDETDPAAYHAADTLTNDILRHHKFDTLADLMARIEEIVAEHGGGDRPVTEEMIGHYCAMQAMGHGVGLYDAFGSAVYDTIHVPYCEFSSMSLEKDYFTESEEV